MNALAKIDGVMPWVSASAQADLAEVRAALTWQPIATAPDQRTMFVVRAFDASIKPGRLYTSDPYCVWRDGDTFARWPHPFPPTHWMPLPAPPEAEA